MRRFGLDADWQMACLPGTGFRRFWETATTDGCLGFCCLEERTIPGLFLLTGVLLEDA